MISGLENYFFIVTYNLLLTKLCFFDRFPRHILASYTGERKLLRTAVSGVEHRKPLAEARAVISPTSSS
jgi:hypothetical protein